MRAKVLVIDDQAEIGNYIRRVAEPIGYEVMVTTESREAMKLFEAFCPDLVILDIVMPDVDGIELLRAFGGAGCKAHVLVVTGFSPSYLESADKLSIRFGLPSVTTMLKPLRLAALRQFLADRAPPATEGGLR